MQTPAVALSLAHQTLPIRINGVRREPSRDRHVLTLREIKDVLVAVHHQELIIAVELDAVAKLGSSKWNRFSSIGSGSVTIDRAVVIRIHRPVGDQAEVESIFFDRRISAVDDFDSIFDGISVGVGAVWVGTGIRGIDEGPGIRFCTVGQRVSIGVAKQWIRAGIGGIDPCAGASFCFIIDAIVIRVGLVGPGAALRFQQIGQTISVLVERRIIDRWIQPIGSFVGVQHAITVGIGRIEPSL